MGTPIGRILLMPKGDYSGSAVYNALDWVRHAGSAWVCTTDNTTGVTPATGVPQWQILASDGSVGGWSTLANKPFEYLGNGMMKASDDSLTIRIGDNLLLGSKLDVDVKQTYIGTGTSSDRPISGAGVKDALDENLDEFTASATCYADSSLVKVSFDDLNTNYGYELCFDDQNQALPSPIPSQIGDPTKGSGTNSGIKLTYTLANATAGTHKFALRILK